MSDQYFSHEGVALKTERSPGRRTLRRKDFSEVPCCRPPFLASIEKQHVEIGAVGPTNVERYLEHAQRGYRQRHGHPPDYRGWRPVQTSSIHMLLRLVQGQWPPVSVEITPAGILQQQICREYARWMGDQRGL